ncbi:hypothetical protein [Sulfitobacter mediterraneus]|uniref:hypothetical protein n=1 Tax=Sulfitobacter mediterraneus TaxID=83219 RepID=UPI0030B881A2
MFPVQFRQEPGGISGILNWIKHLFDAGESMTVPFVIDLKAANIKAARAILEMPEYIGLGLRLGVKPNATALHINSPRPGIESC